MVVAVTSAVVVVLVISILTLIAGFACGYYIRGRKCKEPSKETQNNPLSIASKPAAALFYEDVDVLPNAMEHQG